MNPILVTFLSLALLSAAPASAAPAAANTSVLSVKKEVKTVTFKVNMHCKNCVNKLSENLSFLKGVKDLQISLADKTVTITYDPAKVSPEKFREIITKLGYTVE